MIRAIANSPNDQSVLRLTERGEALKETWRIADNSMAVRLALSFMLIIRRSLYHHLLLSPPDTLPTCSLYIPTPGTNPSLVALSRGLAIDYPRNRLLAAVITHTQST